MQPVLLATLLLSVLPQLSDALSLPKDFFERAKREYDPEKLPHGLIEGFSGLTITKEFFALEEQRRAEKPYLRPHRNFEFRCRMQGRSEETCFAFAKQFGDCRGLPPSSDPSDCKEGRLHRCQICKGKHHNRVCPRSETSKDMKRRFSAVSEGDQIDWTGWDELWATQLRTEWHAKSGEWPSDRQVLDLIRTELNEAEPAEGWKADREAQEQTKRRRPEPVPHQPAELPWKGKFGGATGAIFSSASSWGGDHATTPKGRSDGSSSAKKFPETQECILSQEIPDSPKGQCAVCGKVCAILKVQNLSRKGPYGGKSEWGTCADSRCKELAQRCIDFSQIQANIWAADQNIRTCANSLRAEAGRNDFAWQLVCQMAHTGALCNEVVNVIKNDILNGDAKDPLSDEDLRGTLGQVMTPPADWPDLAV